MKYNSYSLAAQLNRAFLRVCEYPEDAFCERTNCAPLQRHAVWSVCTKIITSVASRHHTTCSDF